MSHRHVSHLSSDLAGAEQGVKRCHEALARAHQNLQAALVYLGKLNKNRGNLQ
jgi:hypothetical protein